MNLINKLKKNVRENRMGDQKKHVTLDTQDKRRRQTRQKHNTEN